MDRVYTMEHKILLLATEIDLLKTKIKDDTTPELTRSMCALRLEIANVQIKTLATIYKAVDDEKTYSAPSR